MKLLVPIKFYVRGGVERVMFSLLREFDGLMDDLVLLVPDRFIQEFQEKLPGTTNITYVSFSWPEASGGFRLLRVLSYLGKIGSILNHSGLQRWSQTQIADLQWSGRIRHVAHQHQCTHCLFVIGNRVPVPRKLDIPLALISHDLFWHFAPFTYTPKLVQEYDESLKSWLTTADLVITVSGKTRSDLLTIFPGFTDKVVAIPLASDRPPSTSRTTEFQPLESAPKSAKTTFFFPSSFNIYKGHLTLFRAAIQLYQMGHRFQVVLTGGETDRLICGKIQPSQQPDQQNDSTYRELNSYIDQCNQLQAATGKAWTEVFSGLGYCSLETVEATYESCDCVVMPSVYEGFGLAITEAIVRGLPVIAADIEVFREQVEFYDCRDRVQFFPPGDADALCHSLETFMASPIPRLTPVEAKERFGHWTWQQVAEGYITALKSLASVVPESAGSSPFVPDS